MSTVEKSQGNWQNLSEKPLDSKYEKCRNITEEIYKRINITFQIKKLEAGDSELSDNSDQIDSNELSNETDLFACDKSDISSSTGAEKPPTDCVKFININNNEEKKKPVYKQPKKRFRKRVKKRPPRASRASESEGSSDEAPLSRVADVVQRVRGPGQPASCVGVPNVIILAADLKSKSLTPNKKANKDTTKKEGPTIDKRKDAEGTIDNELKNCALCSLQFRGDKGLRRHMKTSKCHQSTVASK